MLKIGKYSMISTIIMKLITSANLILAFLLEIALLASYYYYGFHLPITTPLQTLIGIGVPLVVIVFWSFFLAPRAKHRLSLPWLLLIKVLLFSAAVVMLISVEQDKPAILLGILTFINLSLATIFHQA
jgi:hypothetical protein